MSVKLTISPKVRCNVILEDASAGALTILDRFSMANPDDIATALKLVRGRDKDEHVEGDDFDNIILAQDMLRGPVYDAIEGMKRAQSVAQICRDAILGAGFDGEE